MIKRYHELTKEEEFVIDHKGTEEPGSGEYNNFYEPGLYLCRKCDQPLYISQAKFSSFCGWPSFDQELDGAVLRKPDADGRRTEILCSFCRGHLGHVFIGEQYTAKNTRHCVNSLSIRFAAQKTPQGLFRAVFAAGCFWGVEYLMQNLPVKAISCGYMGGFLANPSYEEVCKGESGHKEVVEIIFDEKIISYKDLVKYFFSIHDFSQTNGQGPDIGSQYQSAIFYLSEEQKGDAQEIINKLKAKNYNIATEILPARTFYIAEDYHQNYYAKTKSQPYCHIYRPLKFE